MPNNDFKNFENMMKLAEFGARRHNERRQVIFRIFISYMTLLVVIAGLIMRHWKDELIEKGLFVFFISVFLGVMLYFYGRWLKIFYIGSDHEVRRRDFYLVKAEVISFHMSKGLSQCYSDCKNVPINLANEKNYEISEKCLFEKRRPDINPSINICRKCPPPPTVKGNRHFYFHLFGPAGLTILIIIALASRPISKFFS